MPLWAAMLVGVGGWAGLVLLFLWGWHRLHYPEEDWQGHELTDEPRVTVDYTRDGPQAFTTISLDYRTSPACTTCGGSHRQDECPHGRAA